MYYDYNKVCVVLFKMPALIPIETLSFYLSKSGIIKFRDWFNSIELLKPIATELESLTTIIEQSTWLEDKIRKQTFINIKALIINYVDIINKKDPELVFIEWIESIQKYCFQGGYGYRIQYSGNRPHHWCVKTENYEKVKNIPDIVSLCGVICDKYVNLSDKPENMVWN